MEAKSEPYSEVYLDFLPIGEVAKIMRFSEADIIEEQAHFASVISAFRNYATHSLSANNRRRKDFYSLSKVDQLMLEKLGYKEKLNKVDNAIHTNAKFLDDLVADPEIFGHAHSEQFARGHTEQPVTPHSYSHSDSQVGAAHSHGQQSKQQPSEFDMDKLRSTLKQFVRDWSEEGKLERDACYEPMKDALCSHFSGKDWQNISVLVPGAGLGRLAYDVASLGFTCQGNEFSHYMLLASYFILNRTEKINQHVIHPYIHSFSNIPNEPALLRPVSIPDILPSDLPEGSNFSLVAGDFEEIYGGVGSEGEDHTGKWDAILTCFFIDTAKNIVDYLRIFHKILAPGGVWINLGPLLWHWENNTTNDVSIELDLEQAKQLAKEIGFNLTNERTIDTTYTNNAQCMLGYVYKASFWTATKN